MKHRHNLTSLPEEILLCIISWLDPPAIVSLQLTSKHLLRLCRDNSFWRQLALSPAALSRYRQLVGGGSHQAGNGITAVHRNSNPLDVVVNTSDSWRDDASAEDQLLLRSLSGKQHARVIANWDTTFPQEDPRWYDEYIHRFAPIAVNWPQQPMTKDGSGGTAAGCAVPIDVRGLALYRPPSPAGDGAHAYAVSPLEDGSVCLWDVKGSDVRRKGSIVTQSKAGMLWEHVPPHGYPRRSTVTDPGILESVSLDDHRGIAFFAIGHVLVEVDLKVMRVISEKQYDFSINTLSSIQPGIPLTVGTTLGLHMNDHRTPSHNLDPYAALPQPGPIAIEHLEVSGRPAQISNDFLVAGRFSNILHYDRRQFPKIQGSIYSGAKLCSMASLPYSMSYISNEERRSFSLTEDEIQAAKREAGRTLIACGEYKSKGSLEIYGLSDSSKHLSSAANQQKPIRNRVTAAAAKVLYCANHGNRIVYSDGQGYLKWVERDGFSEARRHKIGQSERASQSSLFRSMPGSDDIAMKILSTRTTSGGVAEDTQANSDDILFWTGDKLGLATFSSKPAFFAEDFWEGTKDDPDAEAEQLYSERMRLALERQAQDVHFVRELGAGSLGGGL
ncbi:uncharacterized protein B0I36DRAFT_327104 [Microdochium trichocladiopsis]|uniref:F-box domain-containing protein n=1 Tax=Microdochium trichocladiopsis TaxID=1682393 RepID=A0A9P8Y2U6_9PEZI|nr:uncharacterized protein B0I36DRAFT_327104 [Microdochium trichocladiopsis]KAH7027449.1 hypothetical protein B0I36DRAFT_327104 [Microdochium trichocladiopsis]